MLVLTRNAGESLVINRDTTFTVLSVQGQRVRIEIEGPRSTEVLRGEVVERWDEIDRQREAEADSQ